MKYSRRVHSLLSVCASVALLACAGEIEVATFGATPALTNEPSAVAYVAEPQPAVPTTATAELKRNDPPSTRSTTQARPSSPPVSSTSANTGSSQNGARPTRPSGVETTPDTNDTEPETETEPQAPAAPAQAPTPVEPTDTASNEIPAPLEPAPATPAVPALPLAAILWSDEIQSSDRSPHGFNQIQLERPIGRAVGGSSEVNLLRVPNPLGAGFALKHVATFDDGGSRAQAGIYSFANDVFNDQVKSPEGVWIAQEWYFPEPLSAGNRLDSEPWVNVWDWHSVGGSDRWDTQPGLMLAEDGSMRVKWTWRRENPDTDWSDIDLPVGEWFDVEMHYVSSSSGTTVSLWINGDLALQQRGVKTKSSSHNSVETYMKFYGSSNGGATWSPRPSVKYMRNVRIAGERIWR